MYINIWQIFWGTVSQNVRFFLNFLKILMVLNKTINRAFRIQEFIKLYKQNALKKFLIFTVSLNKTLALNFPSNSHLENF